MSSLIQNLILREKIIDAIRDYFKKENYHEVETPLLVPSVIPESYLEHFTMTLFDRRRNKKKMFLTSSPEASLKKLIAKGLGNCFEITKSFRNGETDGLLHSPEFTILEWYRVGVDYTAIMNDCERLFVYIYKNLKSQISNLKTKTQILNLNELKLTYQNQTIDLTPPWERISVIEALKKYANVDFDEIPNLEKICKKAKSKGYSVDKNNNWEEIFNQIFLNEVEPHLGTKGKPTIIYDYPRAMAALAKLKKDDPRVSERFELYIGGLELGDCYSELTDGKEQEARFNKELDLIQKSNKTSVKPDKDFIISLKKGLPECAGMAMGIDRIVMLFLDLNSIRDSKFTVD